MRHSIKEEKVGDMSFDRLGLCFWQFWLNELTTPNEWMWSNKPPNWARLNSNERFAPSLPTSGGLKWYWRQNYSDKASKVGNPVSSDSFGWSSWQLETNEYEATDVQNWAMLDSNERCAPISTNFKWSQSGLLRWSLENGRLKQLRLKHNCWKKNNFCFMCLHSKASRGFLSSVHNPSLKIKRLRMDSKSLKNPINTP
jgi:hypothetical protein